MKEQPFVNIAPPWSGFRFSVKNFDTRGALGFSRRHRPLPPHTPSPNPLGVYQWRRFMGKPPGFPLNHPPLITLKGVGEGGLGGGTTGEDTCATGDLLPRPSPRKTPANKKGGPRAASAESPRGSPAQDYYHLGPEAGEHPAGGKKCPGIHRGYPCPLLCRILGTESNKKWQVRPPARGKDRNSPLPPKVAIFFGTPPGLVYIE